MTEIRTRTQLLDYLIRHAMGLTLLKGRLKDKDKEVPPRELLLHWVQANINLLGAVIDMIIEEDNIPDAEMTLRLEHVKDTIAREARAAGLDVE